MHTVPFDAVSMSVATRFKHPYPFRTVNSPPSLITNPAEERRTLTILLAVSSRIRHALELALLDLGDEPSAMLLGLLKELLILLEAAATGLGLIEISPGTGEKIRRTKDQEQPVVETVEHDGCEQRHGEVGDAPDYDADGGALGASGGRVDLGWDELRWRVSESRPYFSGSV